MFINNQTWRNIMAKSKIAKKVVDLENNQVTFLFSDQNKVIADLGYFDETMIYRLALHGLAQKLGDSYAGVESVDEAKLNVTDLLAQLQSGVWAAKSSRGGIWVESIARALKITFEEALEKWEGLDEENQKKVKNHPDVKVAKAQIELERAQKAIPADTTKVEPLTL